MLYRREFDLLSYTGGCFQYQYQSNGKDVMVNFVVDEVDGDVCISVDGQSIGLTYEDFDKCEDIDDCSLIIARHYIKDNDGDVLTQFVDYRGYTPTGIEHLKRMNKNLEFINDADDDSWYLTLYADGWRKPTSFGFYEVNEKDIPEIISMMEDGDNNGVYEYISKSENLNTWELFNVWSEPYEEVIGFELNDETGKTVDGGKMLVSEFNIYDYEDCQSTPVVDRLNHPKYLIVTSESVKDSCVSFCVPKDFKVGEIRFIESNPTIGCPFDMQEFGDWKTSLYSFKYQGKVYEADDFCDNGTYGDIRISLFEWDYEGKKGFRRGYNIISKC